MDVLHVLTQSLDLGEFLIELSGLALNFEQFIGDVGFDLFELVFVQQVKACATLVREVDQFPTHHGTRSTVIPSLGVVA